MFLTRIALNLEKRAALMALSSPNQFHGALESSFAGERPRVLWRIDKLNQRYYILILSPTVPDFSSFIAQFGYDGEGPEIRDYTLLLNRISQGSRWMFRINANPTYREPKKEGELRAKRHAHTTIAHQQRWLMENCSKYGFSLSETSFRVTDTKWYRFHKEPSSRVTLLSVTYEGVLEVTDAPLFRHTLCNGLGRGKAYGLGLLTVVRCHG